MPGLRTCLAVLIWFFLLPAQAQAQAIDVKVEASNTNIARGGTATVTVSAEITSGQLEFFVSATTPVFDSPGFPPLVSVSRILVPSNNQNILNMSVADSEQLSSFTLSFFKAVRETQEIDFVPSNSIRRARAWTEPNVLPFTVCETAETCPADTIRLKLRVFLEGALPRR